MEFEESGDLEFHFQKLVSLAKEGVLKGKVVAVGECGLDYDRLRVCPAKIQKKYFENQFQLAEALKLPMFLHMRAVVDDFCNILTKQNSRFTFGVAHSFIGRSSERDKLLSFYHLYIGINGYLLKTKENLEVLRDIHRKMMIETDSPYCDIRNTHTGMQIVKTVWPSKTKENYDQDSAVKGRNEPCCVRQVLEVVAECKGIADIEQLSIVLYRNTCRVFFPHDLDAAAGGILEKPTETQSSNLFSTLLWSDCAFVL